MDVLWNQTDNFSSSLTHECPNFGQHPSWHSQDPQNYLGQVGAVVICLQIVLGCLGNTLVILAVLTTKSLRKSFNAFIVTLAVTDVLFTSLVMPFYAESFIHRGWRLSKQWCVFHTYIGVILEIGSVWQISAIAFYRYLLIVHPHLYHKLSSRTKIISITVGIFVFSVLVILPNLFRLDGYIAYSDQLGRCNYVRRESKLTLYWFFCAAYIPSGVCMILCYVGIMRALQVSKARVNINIQFFKSTRSSHRLSDPTPRRNKHRSRKGNESSMGNKLRLPTGPCYLSPPNMTPEQTGLCDDRSTEDGSTSTLKLSQDFSSEEVFRPRAMTWPSSPNQTSQAAGRQNDSPTPSQGTRAPLVPRPLSPASPSHHQQAHSFRMIVVIFITFFVTYMPFTIVNLADVNGCFSRSTYMLTSLFFWMGVCVNPFIYGAMNTNFLQAYKNLLLKCWPSKPEDNAWF